MASDEEIERKLHSLEISKLEKEGISLPGHLTKQSEQECRNNLLIRVIVDKGVSFDGLKGALTTVWRFFKGFKLMSLGSTIFQAMFESEEDIERILKGCPWYYNSCLLVIKKWTEDLDLKEDGFNFAPVWKQVWNLPLKWASDEMGMHLCEQFGVVKEFDSIAGESSYGKNFRAKVVIDISKPLIQGMPVTKDNDTGWATIKYENIGYFFYYRAIIGHAVRGCKYKLIDQIKGIHKDELYDSELKALSFRQKLGKMAQITAKSMDIGFKDHRRQMRETLALKEGSRSIERKFAHHADGDTGRKNAATPDDQEFDMQIQELIWQSIAEERLKKGKDILKIP